PIGAGENELCFLDLLRSNTRVGRERQERSFVARNVSEHAAEKARFFGRDAYRAGVDPGQRQEARKLIGVACDESERHDRQFARRVRSALMIDVSAPGSAT